MSQPCLVAATQCAAMQKGLAQRHYCESCVDAVDQVQLGIRVRGSTMQVVRFAAYIP